MPTALLSVHDKEGIGVFAQKLIELGWTIVSSGGTARELKKGGITVTDVASFTGREPVLGHRVVTLDPKIHGGLLATPEQEPELQSLGWPWLDLVCVDLYPLEKEIARAGSTPESVIEQTDIGGPTLLRSAAKGRRIVIADPEDRQRVIDWLKNGCPDKETFITALAAKAEGIVAGYALASARFHSGGKIEGLIGTQQVQCKYGENAWQQPAGLYACTNDDPLALPRFKLVEGAPLSLINLRDADRLLQTVTHIAAAFDLNPDAPTSEIPTHIAVGVKHGNPCGASIGHDPNEVLGDMLCSDPLAILGGFVMVNFPVGKDEAHTLRTWGMQESKKRLLDGVVAPSFTDEAIEELGRKQGKCRMLANPALAAVSRASLDQALRICYVRGGFLVQPNYTYVLDLQDPRTEHYGDRFENGDTADALLAWAIGSTSNSNTITLVKNGKLIGNGVGQQDRVGAAELAVQKARRAGHDIKDATAYSDSFFPFPDGPQVLADAGVTTILTSSGSVNDEKTRALCKERGILLIMVPDAQGRGFYGH